MSNIKDYNKEKALYLVFSATIIEEAIRALFLAINITPFFVAYIDIAIYMFAGLYFLKNNALFLNKGLSISVQLGKTIILMFLLVVSFILSNRIDQTVSKEFTLPFIYVLVIGGIFYLLGQHEYDLDKVFCYFSLNYIPASIYAVIRIFILHSSGYMTISYNIMPWALVAYIMYINKRQVIHLIMFVTLCLFILVGGARMPLLCIAIFVLIDNFISSKNNLTSKKVLLYLITAIVMLIVYLCFDRIIEYAVTIFPNARTLKLIADGVGTNDSGRSGISDFLIAKIKEKPLSFRGLYADRIAISNRYYNTNELGIWILEDNKYNLYSHNIFLELFFDFGIIIGGAFSLFLILRTIKLFGIIWNNKSDYLITQFLLFSFMVGFVPLIVSNSILILYYFWFYLSVSKRSNSI